MITSPNDSKHYRALNLKNGLRVVIVSDKDSEKSAAALTVNCGHFDDPADRQGMAHFVEHLSFLGTKSDPDPGAFHQFISDHGGSHNAWTGTEHTSYFFDINNEFIDEALKRFSDFFVEPLMSIEYIEKERNAIDAEYKLKLKEDSHRIYQVHKESINPAHPFSKFSVGNIDTLADRNGQSIRDELVEFHDKYYVPQLMALAVLSPLSLDEMEKQVVALFSRIEDRPAPDRNITVPLYLPENQQVAISIVPHKHSQKLLASFAMPNTDKFYKCKTIAYMAHLIGHEGKGSLLSKLKSLGWVNHLSVGRGISGNNFKDFNVSFDLTTSGINHTDEIIDLMFEAIDALNDCDNHQVLYGDKQKLMQLAFDYQEKTKPINQVSHISTNMFNYEPQDYLCGDYIMNGFDQQQYQTFLKLLCPENMRLVYVHPDVETDRIAKWYDTPYSVKPIDPAKIARWKQITHQDDELLLPVENPYLKKPVVMEPRNADEITEVPQIIAKSEGFNFYFKQDEMFNVPKGHCYIAIDCPISTASIKNIAITRLFTELFLDAVLEDHYNAELAGLSYHVYVHQGGLTVHTSGISTNQHLLIELLLDSLQNMQFTAERFVEIKNQLYSHWLNSAKSKPVSQLFSVLTSTLQPNNPTMEQMADALHEVTFDEFLQISEQLFTQIHVDAFAYGNWRKSQALELAKTVEQQVFAKAKPHKEVFRPLLSLKDQHNLAIEKDLHHYDNAIVMFYQGDSRQPLTQALFIMLNHIIGPSFFHQLRTEKQLGYLVGTGFVPLNRYPGMALYIQSPDHSSITLYHEIQQFLQGFCQHLPNVDPQQWQKIQRGVITQVIEKDANLRLRSQRFWVAIGNKDYDFDEREQVARQVMQLTPQEVYEFAKQTFLDAGDRKLVAKTRNKNPEASVLQVVPAQQLSTLLTPLND